MLIDEIPIPDFCIGCPSVVEKAFAGDRYSGHCLEEQPDPIKNCLMRAVVEKHHAEKTALKTPMDLLRNWLKLYDQDAISDEFADYNAKEYDEYPNGWYDWHEELAKKTRELLQ